MILLISEEDDNMKANERIYKNVTEQRKKIMSHIRRKDTSIELTLRKELWHRGYRYRKNYKDLPGSPDICLTKYKLAIFLYFFHPILPIIPFCNPRL